MWHYEKDHAEISRPEVVSVYSSHIQNVDFLNRNTERLSMRWDPINGYLGYSITWLTQLWSMPGYCKVSAKTGRTVINQQAIRIDFATAWTGIVCTETEHGVLTTEKAPIQTLPSPQGTFELRHTVTCPFGRARGKHAKSHTICSTHHFMWEIKT